MRQWRLLLGVILGVGLVTSANVLSVSPKLIWNRTASAPVGLYWRNGSPPNLRDWAVISANSAEAIWARENGFSGSNWPLIKRVSGVHGDEICRSDVIISINGEAIAEAISKTENHLELPTWSGCIRLGSNEIFLLNEHPKSLDGRYFGPINVDEIEGSATLIWSAE